jgi:hypothetical protein
MSQSTSEDFNLPTVTSAQPFPIAPQPTVEPIRLENWHGRNGILQSIQWDEDGYIMADLSGSIVELPAELEGKLRPLMGLPARVAIIDGVYYAAKWTRRAQACASSGL